MKEEAVGWVFMLLFVAMVVLAGVSNQTDNNLRAARTTATAALTVTRQTGNTAYDREYYEYLSSRARSDLDRLEAEHFYRETMIESCYGAYDDLAAQGIYLTPGPCDLSGQSSAKTYSSCSALTANTNIREGPGLDYPIWDTWKEGTCVGPYARTSDSEWIQLADEDGYPTRYWVHADLVQTNVYALPLAQSGFAGTGSRNTSPSGCPGGCTTYPTWCTPPIKGNIGFNSGERIYHVPGGEYYASTTIDPSYGERWFCTEAEAQAAGWRRSSN